MKLKLKNGRSWIRYLTFAGLFCVSSTGVADLIRSPTAATSPETTNQGSLGQLIDQSGITPFISGVTDFDTYGPTAVSHPGLINDVGWFGGPTKAEMSSTNPGEIAIDLGAVFTLTRVAYWQTTGISRLSAVTIYSDTDDDFTNGFTANIGSFSPADSLLGHVFDVTDASTRYLQFQWTDIHPSTSTFRGGLGEFAVAIVPEPASLTLLGLTGPVLLGVRGRHKRLSRV